MEAVDGKSNSMEDSTDEVQSMDVRYRPIETEIHTRHMHFLVSFAGTPLLLPNLTMWGAMWSQWWYVRNLSRCKAVVLDKSLNFVSLSCV